MYQNLQVLDKNNNLKFDPSVGYSFAAKENLCPVLLQEMPRIIREYFVCFPSNQTELPHVLLGFEKEVNRYVDEQGQWQADYIPAFIRRYPFILAQVKDKSEEQFSLAADIDAPHFAKETGNPLFEADGQPSQALQNKVSLLKSYEQQRRLTQQVVKSIDSAGLFKMEQMRVKSGAQDLASVSGLRMVDEEKLQTVDLKPGPVLELIYAHLFSRVNLQMFDKLKQRKIKSETQEVDIEKLFGEDDFIKFD